MERKYNFGSLMNQFSAQDNPELTNKEEAQPEPTAKTIEEKYSDAESNIKNVIPDNHKTLLMFSRENGLDKQRVYRYIKAKKVPVNIINDTIYIDDAVQSKLISYFQKNSDVLKKHKKSTSRISSKGTSIKREFKEFIEAINMLKTELNIKTEQLQEKDRQIVELTKIIEYMTKGSN